MQIVGICSETNEKASVKVQTIDASNLDQKSLIFGRITCPYGNPLCNGRCSVISNAR